LNWDLVAERPVTSPSQHVSNEVNQLVASHAMFDALMGTIFLILVATSTAVTGSMIVLALFDRAFGKKSAPPVVADTMESGQLKPPLKLKSPAPGSKAKIEPLVASSGAYRAKRKPNPGYGPQTQRVIHLG
jgi:hypothetical protein